MPRRKKAPVKKTALEVAIENAPSAVDDAATAMSESAAKTKRKRRAKPKAKTETRKLWELPKLKFRKKRVSYNEGDRVEILEAGETFSGTLIDILASQLVVRNDEGVERFFFQSGINIKKQED